MLARARWSQIVLSSLPPEDHASKQRAWNVPAVTRDWHCRWDHATCDLDKARLMVIISQHGSDWLFALPVSVCGLPLSNYAKRIGVGLIGLVSICVNPTSARFELTLMREDCTVFPANAPPAGRQDTNSSIISFGGHSSELTILLPRNLQVLFEGTESVQ